MTSPGGLTVRQAPIPTPHAILWVPQGGAVPATMQFPVFFAPSALRAINEHFRASPESGLLGFLTGDLCEDAVSHARYVVVDSTVRLTQPIYGDKTTVVVSRVMDRVHKELAKTNGHVIGWYHSHPPLGLSLAAGDLETHVTFFGKAWHVALVLGGTADQPVAALFRVPSGEPTALVALPFYEVIDEKEASTPGGKVSHLPWRNFRTADRAATRGATAAMPAPRPSTKGAASAARSTLEVMRPAQPAPAPPPPPPPKPPPPAPPPQATAPRASATAPRPAPPAKPSPSTAGLPLLELGAPMPEPTTPHEPPPRQSAHRMTAPTPAPPPAPRPSDPARRRTSRPVVHASLAAAKRGGGSGHGWVWGLLLLLALGGGGAYYYFKIRPGLAGRTATPPVPTATPSDTTLTRFEAAADSAMSVVRNYGDRARLFASRQITCAELTRGFAAVENQMLAYGTARKALKRPLDPAHVERDRALFAAVDTVDAHFDRSRCPRP